MVGNVAVLTEWAVFASLLYLISFGYLMSAVIAFFVATTVNYVLSLIFVFYGGRHTRFEAR
jgi:putative flippase GtrA